MADAEMTEYQEPSVSLTPAEGCQRVLDSVLTVPEERKERVERQPLRHNDANMTAEKVWEDVKVVTTQPVSRRKQVRESTAVLQKSSRQKKNPSH